MCKFVYLLYNSRVGARSNDVSDRPHEEDRDPNREKSATGSKGSRCAVSRQTAHFRTPLTQHRHCITWLWSRYRRQFMEVDQSASNSKTRQIWKNAQSSGDDLRRFQTPRHSVYFSPHRERDYRSVPTIRGCLRTAQPFYDRSSERLSRGGVSLPLAVRRNECGDLENFHSPRSYLRQGTLKPRKNFE